MSLLAWFIVILLTVLMFSAIGIGHFIGQENRKSQLEEINKYLLSRKGETIYE